jgi:replicative DNA helicase
MASVVPFPPQEDEQQPADALPQNVEAEAALLGALMLENSLIDAIADTLSPEHFFEPLHGRIFSAIVMERSHGRAANPITLRPQFEHDPSIADLGGPAYLAGLSGHGAAIIGARDFALQIKDLAFRRMFLSGLGDVIESVRSCDGELPSAVAATEAVLAGIEDDNAGTEEISAGKAALRVVDNLSKPDRHAGVRSGIDVLDAVLGPLRPKSLTILAARPGMGKSALAISYGNGAAKRESGVLFINLEMDNDDIAERAMCDIAFDEEFGPRVPFNAVTSGNVDSAQARTLTRAAMALDELPITFVDIAAAGPAKISRLIRRHKRRFEAKGHKLELVIVDYLQLMSADTKAAGPYERVSEASRGLKRAAKENGVAILALCQLSREVERRADKRPMLSDLRDSGQIEQDADAVLFLLRPEYYLEQAKPEVDEQLLIWEEAMRTASGVIEFIAAKVRRRKSGMGKGFFSGAYQAVRS